jgi:hypothetical protein
VDVGFRGPIVVGGHDRIPIFGGVPPVGIARINNLVHGHHGRLIHIVIDRGLHGGLLVVRGIVVWRAAGRYVHTGGAHLSIVHGRAHTIHV